MRSQEQIRGEIQAEREQLTRAVDELRESIAKATDIAGKVKAKLPLVAAVGAAGATMRYFARRARKRR